MSSRIVSPGDMRDGCGPYGNHVTGATGRQKYFGTGGLGAANLIMAANIDWLIPVPPPSEPQIVSAYNCRVTVGGTTSFLRMGLYDMSVFPGGALIADGGEVDGDAIALKTFAMAVTIPKNARYAILLCARGVVLPTLLIGNAGFQPPSWLGIEPATLTPVGMETYSRANAAFPATYNGAYASVLTSRVLGGFTL